MRFNLKVPNSFLCLSYTIYLHKWMESHMCCLCSNAVYMFTEQHETEQIDYQGICWQTVTETMTCTQPLGHNRKTTYTECCCLYGEAWGMDCALCPPKNTGTNYTTPCTHIHIYTLSGQVQAHQNVLDLHCACLISVDTSWIWIGLLCFSHRLYMKMVDDMSPLPSTIQK